MLDQNEKVKDLYYILNYENYDKSFLILSLYVIQY